jgi:twitching motility protein PilT
VSLFDSLLDAIIRLGGDALVMHVGERPYVVTTSNSLDEFRGPLSWGQVELSSRPLTQDAVFSMLGQMLPYDVRQTLDDVGAIEHEIESPDGRHRFVVVAARGGDDVWVEVRRKAEEPPRVEPQPQAGTIPEPVLTSAVEATGVRLPTEAPTAQAAGAGEGKVGEISPVEMQPVEQPEAPVPPPEATVASAAGRSPEPAAFDDEVTLTFDEPHRGGVPARAPAPQVEPPVVVPAPEPVAEADPELDTEAVALPTHEPLREAAPAPVMRLQPRDPAPAHASTSAVADVLRDGLERGASTVYAIGGLRPLMRIEGDITSSASLPVLQPADIDRFAFEFAPRGEVAHSTSEWTTTVPGAGRVRCVSFEDATGRGLVFHLAANVSSADELGLGREIQALCNEADGLVIVAGPRASGKSTLLGAFVDRINRSRADHIITIESRVHTLHERRHSLISQREVDGDGLAIARAARAALREGPDVLVIDDARAPETIAVAIDAARAGRLVFASLPAPGTSAAIERLTDAFTVDRRPQIRALLSGALRAVISQVLIRKVAGGRIAAREVLLSSPPVVQLIVDGNYAQVPVAIESGRRLGMRTITDSLAALVREGIIAGDAAMAAAPDRRVLLAALRQEGIDVSELERRA